MAGRNGGDPAGRNGGDPVPATPEERAARDERVLAIAVRAFEGFDPRGHPDTVFEDLAERVTSVMREHPEELLYVARGVIDGEPGALGIFDAFMAIATTSLEALRDDGLLDPELDLDWAALHVVMFNLSTVLFEQAIDNHLPEGVRTPEGIARWHAADTELFRRGFLRQVARSG